MNTVIQLGDIASVVMGQAPPGKDCNKEGNGYPFVKAGEFSGDRPILREWTTNPLKKAKDGDVLVCVVGATAGKINLGIDCAIGRSVAAVRPLPERLYTNYLHHFLRTKTLVLRHGSQGLAQGVITREMLLGLEIPLPPLEEQRRIAAILDRVSFLLMRSDNACTLVDRLQESIFIQSFGEFGEAAARYPTLKLEDVCSLITDGEHQTPLRSDSGVKLLSARNIRNGKLDFSDVDFVPMEEFARIGRRCAPVRGDVLISCSGSIGRVAVVDTDEPLAMVRSAAMARPIQAKVRPFYLEILLRSRHLQQCMQKSANASSQANLFQGKIRALPVFLPSLEEQDAFVARASKARASAHILASRVIELQALMQSAQNAAFSGGIQQ